MDNMQRKVPLGEKIANIYNKVGVLAILIILIIACSIISPVFLSKTNIINLLTQISVVTIMACGITMLIIMGCIDFSLCAIATLSAAVGGITPPYTFLTSPFLSIAVMSRRMVGALA